MATKLTKSSAKKLSGGASTSATAKSKKKPIVTTKISAGGASLAGSKKKLAKADMGSKSGAGPWPNLGLAGRGGKVANSARQNNAI